MNKLSNVCETEFCDRTVLLRTWISDSERDLKKFGLDHDRMEKGYNFEKDYFDAEFLETLDHFEEQKTNNSDGLLSNTITDEVDTDKQLWEKLLEAPAEATPGQIHQVSTWNSSDGDGSLAKLHSILGDKRFSSSCLSGNVSPDSPAYLNWKAPSPNDLMITSQNHHPKDKLDSNDPAEFQQSSSKELKPTVTVTKVPKLEQATKMTDSLEYNQIARNESFEQVMHTKESLLPLTKIQELGTLPTFIRLTMMVGGNQRFYKYLDEVLLPARCTLQDIEKVRNSFALDLYHGIVRHWKTCTHGSKFPFQEELEKLIHTASKSFSIFPSVSGVLRNTPSVAPKASGTVLNGVQTTSNPNQPKQVQPKDLTENNEVLSEDSSEGPKREDPL